MRIRSLVGIIIVAIGILITIYSINDMRDQDHEGDPAKPSYSATNIKELTIRSSSVNVVVEPNELDKVELKLSSRRSKEMELSEYVYITENNEHLTLNVYGPNNMIASIINGGMKLTLSIPKHMLEVLNTTTSSGNISIEALDIPNIQLKASSGNIHANQIEATSFSSKSSSGNISLEKVFSDEITIAATSGNVKLDTFETQTIKASTSSGNMKLNDGSAAINASTTSGNINLHLDQLLNDSKLQSSSGNINLTLEKQPTSLFVSHHKSSGNTVIKKADFNYSSNASAKHVVEGSFGSGELKLEVKTSSGNFVLN